MLVGVLSDTHGRLPAQAYAALADCDHIIHAGDIGSPDIIRELQTLAPVTAVLGNNDYAEYGSSGGRFAKVCLDGVNFLVAHYPLDVRILATLSVVAAGEPIPDICIHGHTHVPRLDFGRDVRPAQFIVNPGSVSRPRDGHQRSIAKIELDNGRIISIVVESLSGTEIMAVRPGVRK